MRCFSTYYSSLSICLVVLSGVFADESAKSWLLPVQLCTDTIKPGSNAGYLALSPDGQWISLHNGSIYRRDTESGKVSLVHSVQPADPTVGLPCFSPDSQYAYAYGMRDVVVWRIDGQRGAVTTVQHIRDTVKDNIVGLGHHGPLCIPSDGNHVYIANGQDQTVVCFQRHRDTGELSFLECLQDDSAALPIPPAPQAIATLFPEARKTDGVGMVSAMASSPDGKQILMGVAERKGLAIFDRNSKTGRLSFVSTVVEEPNRFGNGINQVRDITFADEGRFLVSASVTGGISLFTRDETLREPIFEQVHYGDIPGLQEDASAPKLKVVAGLKNPRSLVFLPGDFHLIAASPGENAVHAFRFDPDIPALKWVGTIRDGENGLTGLKYPNDLAVSPDGKFLYVASQTATIAVFEIKL
jgi:6-phosphogluconolactonase (cycloisomerase 2 family)